MRGEGGRERVSEGERSRERMVLYGDDVTVCGSVPCLRM